MLERDPKFHSDVIMSDEMRVDGCDAESNSVSSRVHNVHVPERQNKFAEM
jgi:hypothetical protein